MQIDINELRALWTRLLPNEPIPDDDQWELWLALHEPSIVRAAITQLAVKYKNLHGCMDRDYMLKFASSVANRLGRESHAPTST